MQIQNGECAILYGTHFKFVSLKGLPEHYPRRASSRDLPSTFVYAPRLIFKG